MQVYYFFLKHITSFSSLLFLLSFYLRRCQLPARLKVVLCVDFKKNLMQKKRIFWPPF
jgi:hypothetical protein